jgi:hypothetical protein
MLSGNSGSVRLEGEGRRIMNRSQKIAWMMFVETVLLVGFFFFLYYQISIRNELSIFKLRLWALLFFVIVGSFLVFIFKKRNKTTVVSDERDVLIEKRAFVAAYLSSFMLLPAGLLVLQLLLGLRGTIEIWLLTLVMFLILQLTILVYSVAILVQYGRDNKGEKS